MEAIRRDQDDRRGMLMTRRSKNEEAEGDGAVAVRKRGRFAAGGRQRVAGSDICV
jgi:hypothetical protein